MESLMLTKQIAQNFFHLRAVICDNAAEHLAERISRIGFPVTKLFSGIYRVRLFLKAVHQNTLIFGSSCIIVGWK